VSSKETDLADRAYRERQTEAALAADRAGRDRLIRQADEQPRDRNLGNTPNTGGRRG
jgi:hypothetical protein